MSRDTTLPADARPGAATADRRKRFTNPRSIVAIVLHYAGLVDHAVSGRLASGKRAAARASTAAVTPPFP